MKQYDKSLCYELKVINTYIDNENYFYIVEDTETRYKVRLFDFQKKTKATINHILQSHGFRSRRFSDIRTGQIPVVIHSLQNRRNIFVQSREPKRIHAQRE